MSKLSSYKEFGLAFNAWFEKYLMLIIPVSLILGFLFSRALEGFVGWVPYLFAFLTFVMALGCSWEQVKEALRMPGAIAVTLLVTHAVAPPLAYGLGVMLFGPDSPYVIGLVLFAVIPLGVSSVIWVGIAGGHIPLALSMIVLDSLLAPFIVPAEISLFFGTAIDFEYWKVVGDLLVIIVIPTILGVLINKLTRGKAKPWSAPVALPVSKLCFQAVVLINAAAIQPSVVQMKGDMPRLIPVVLFLVFMCYMLGYLGAYLFRQRALSVTLMFASGMRNISLGVVLGLAYFEPAAAVPVVMSILIQQPMATFVNALISRFMRKGYRMGQSSSQASA